MDASSASEPAIAARPLRSALTLGEEVGRLVAQLPAVRSKGAAFGPEAPIATKVVSEVAGLEPANARRVASAVCGTVAFAPGLSVDGAMSRITLDQLRTFMAVVRLGGVRKASVGLNLTQPAVTARIRNLETELGCVLFERTSGGMRLTKRGELLHAHAEQVEHLMEKIGRDVADPAGVEARLRLGVSETIAECWLPELIARLHARYPRLGIEFNVDISNNLRAGLLNREVDLAILLGPVSEFTVDNVELPGFDLAWYVAADAPEDTDGLYYRTRPVLTYGRHTRPHRELKDMLMDRAGPDVAIFPCSSLSACFRLVAANLGVAALPRALGAPHEERGRIREFDPGWVPPPLVFSASYLGTPRSAMVESAAALAREVARDFDGDQKI